MEKIFIQDDDTIITISNLEKFFISKKKNKKSEVVFKSFSLNVTNGEKIAILGKSGCGKTTLLNLIAKIDNPNSGEINVKQERIGYMFQTDRLLPWLNAKKNALLGFEMFSKTKNHILNLKKEFDRVSLNYDEIKDKYPSQLSGGMRQRIAFIRTILYNPDILLLDEPFSALDFETKLILESQLIKFIIEEGRTMVFVTHDIDEAIALADRLIILQGDPISGHSTRIIYDSKIWFDSDVAGRDPVKVRQDPCFTNYFKIVWDKLRTNS